MLFFIVAIIIGLIKGIINWFHYDIIDGFFTWLNFTFFGVLISMVIASFIGICVEDHNVGTLVQKTNIVALKDNIDIEGNKFLLHTNIDSEIYYYYLKDTRYGYLMDKIPAKTTYVRCDSNNYRIEEYGYYGFDNNIFWWFALPMRDREYIVYIPEQSIVYDYEIDLE